MKNSLFKFNSLYNLSVVFSLFLFLNTTLNIFDQNPESPISTFTDTRDGQVYKIVAFNNDLGMGVRESQIWMAENLRFEVEDRSWWYDNNGKINKKYGLLYTWDAAKIACPEGWRLPTDIDWQILMHQITKGGLTVDGAETAYKLLLKKEDSSFAALLGGIRPPHDNFSNLDDFGFYWTASENGVDSAWNYYFNSNEVNRSFSIKSIGFSCRCIKD